MKGQIGCSCSPHADSRGKCTIESVISIDDRGQLILPKAIRDKFGISGGDKLVLISWEKEGEAESISLIPNEKLSHILANQLYQGEES